MPHRNSKKGKKGKKPKAGGSTVDSTETSHMGSTSVAMASDQVESSLDGFSVATILLTTDTDVTRTSPVPVTRIFLDVPSTSLTVQAYVELGHRWRKLHHQEVRPNLGSQPSGILSLIQSPDARRRARALKTYATGRAREMNEEPFLAGLSVKAGAPGAELTAGVSDEIETERALFERFMEAVPRGSEDGVAGSLERLLQWPEFAAIAASIRART